MKRRLWVGSALILGLASTACVRSGDADTELAVLPLGGDFELTSSKGPIDLASLRGHPAWLFFGYTSCPDVCPTTLSRLTRARELLRERGCDEPVTTLFVSVDPERDTPERIADYLGYFGLEARGATGTAEQLAAVGKAYGVTWERVPGSTPASDLVNHSTYVFLLDDLGRVRHVFGHGDSPEEVADLTARLAAADRCR